ncbi:MAG TPA: hypothetical protein VGO46_14490 [Gemmatimonadaceae bacterium]|jgi:hypothetical protein|nr:hypothetical protein [Gemmatimonadaceae bacterium]
MLPTDEQDHTTPPPSTIAVRLIQLCRLLGMALIVVAPATSLRAQGRKEILKTLPVFPSIDGRIDAREWPEVGTFIKQYDYGWLLLRADETTLYVAADVTADTVADPIWSTAANGDLFQLYVDINGDGALNVSDVTYRAKPGTDTRAVLVIGALISTPYEKFTPTNASIVAGFGTSARGATPHRMWELAIPISELTSRRAGTIGLAASVTSARPSFSRWGPANNAMFRVDVVLGSPPTLRLPVQLRQVATNTPEVVPTGGSDNTSRRILPDGTVEVTFPDGSKIQRLGGSTTRISPDGRKSTYSAMTVARPSPPALPSEAAVETWIDAEAADLLETISGLLGGDSVSIANYTASEHGLSLYEKVDKRIRCIFFLTATH